MKIALAERGETQKSLAAAVAVKPASLNLVLNGRVRPWPALKRRIAEYLERPEHELFPPELAEARS